MLLDGLILEANEVCVFNICIHLGFYFANNWQLKLFPLHSMKDRNMTDTRDLT